MSDALASARLKDSPLKVQIAVMAAVIVPLIVLSQIIAYWRIDVVDDQMFAYFGWRIANGGTVYLDVWDNKPPGIYWINAVAMFLSGGSYFGVLVMCGLALAVAHAAFFIAGCQVFYRGAAALATILLSFFLTHAYYTGGTNRTETFVAAFELSAAALYLRAFTRDRWWQWLVAGMLCGGAFLFKQIGLSAWGAMGLHLILLGLTRQIPITTAAWRCVLLLVGMLATVGTAAGYLAAQGALDAALFATFGYNRAYFEGGNTQFPYGVVNWYLLRHHVHPILLLPLLMASAATIHAFLWWLRPAYRPADIERPLKALGPVPPLYMFFFGVWFLAASYGALISPMGFRHYIVPSIPPLMFLAGYLINIIRTEVRLLDRLQQRGWVAAAVVAMGFFAWQAVMFQVTEVSKVVVTRMDQGERAAWEVAGERVRELTRPGDTIQCLGYMPGVYLIAQRPNVSRFATTEKVAHAAASDISLDIAGELEQTLAASAPVLIVMNADDFYFLRSRGDKKGWPTGDGFHRWLVSNYRLVDEIPKYGTLLFFMRNDRFDPAIHADRSDVLKAMDSRGS